MTPKLASDGNMDRERSGGALGTTSIGIGIIFHPYPQTLRGQERVNSKELTRT